jgi:hypothetical protein
MSPQRRPQPIISKPTAAQTIVKVKRLPTMTNMTLLMRIKNPGLNKSKMWQYSPSTGHQNTPENAAICNLSCTAAAVSGSRENNLQ